MEQLESNFTIGQAKGCLIVQPHGAVPLSQIALIQEQLLPKLQQNFHHYVVLDLKGVSMLDSVEFTAIKKLLSMCQLMGAKAVITSIHYQIASALAQIDIDLTDIIVEKSIDEAISKYGQFDQP